MSLQVEKESELNNNHFVNVFGPRNADVKFCLRINELILVLKRKLTRRPLDKKREIILKKKELKNVSNNEKKASNEFIIFLCWNEYRIS